MAVSNLIPPDPQEAAAAAAEQRYAALLALGDVSQANAATCIYGDSGSGKSDQIAEVVEYGWERYHRLSRVVTADLGGFGNKLLRLIRLGIAQVWNPTNHIEPMETMEDASFGAWPEKIDDPYTGYAQPDVRLVMPQETRWTVFCQAGHPVKTVRSKTLLNGFSIQCPTCKTVTTMNNWSKVTEASYRAPGAKHVGLYMFDSGTSLQDWAMQDMAFRAARGEIGGEGSALGKDAKIISGKYTFGSNNRAHYGFAQNRIHSWVKNSRTIPGQVVPPIWTFLELRSTDDARGVPIFGPKIAGSAKTADIPSWMGNCVHASKEENDKGRMVFRLWLTTHIDPGSTIPHLAKTRAEPGTLPNYLEDDEKEEPYTRCSMKYFFYQLEEALKVGQRIDAEKYADAPVFVPFPESEEEILSSKDLSGSETGIKAGGGARPAMAPAPVARPAAAVARPAAAPAAAVAPVTAGASAPAKPVAPVTAGSPVVMGSVAAPAAPAKATAPAKVAAPAAPVAAARPAQPTLPAPPAAVATAAPKPAQPAASVQQAAKPVAAPAPAARVAPAAVATAPRAVQAPGPQPVRAVAAPAPAPPAPIKAEVPPPTGPVVAAPSNATAVPTTARPPAVAAIARPPGARPPAAPPGVRR